MVVMNDDYVDDDIVGPIQNGHKIVYIYRAMLSIARTTLSKDVLPSVCLSHAGIVSNLDMYSLFFSFW